MRAFSLVCNYNLHRTEVRRPSICIYRAQNIYKYLQILSTLSTGGEASLSRDGQLCLDVLLERQVTSYLHTHLYLQYLHIYIIQYLRVHLNFRHHFSSPWRVKEIMKSSMYLPSAVRELNIQARRVLPHFIGENQDMVVDIL